jgi:ubiquinone/menaquinone biosynthesis C-methylase UbiE
MSLDLKEWHLRYEQQAGWTQSLREHLYQRAGVENARRVLDVGCGTGALLGELSARVQGGSVHGLDLQRDHLVLAMRNNPAVSFVQADALALPYPDGSFDLALCHFVLLWTANPVQAVSEMKRAVRPGGSVLALAEPDYGGRIDYPEALEAIGRWQLESLSRQGAEPQTGRRLGQIFHQAGLSLVQVGILGGQWTGKPDREAWALEWRVLEADLGSDQEGLHSTITENELAALKTADWEAWQRGERVLFVPTFYAWGKKPGGME